SREAASPLYLRSGDEFRQTDLVLPETNTGCLEGKVLLEGRPDSGWISISVSEAYVGSQTRFAVGRMRAGGRFRTCGLSSGNYFLKLMASVDSKPVYGYRDFYFDASKPLRLDDISLEPGNMIHGSIRVEGEGAVEPGAAALAGMRISLTPAERLPGPE